MPGTPYGRTSAVESLLLALASASPDCFPRCPLDVINVASTSTPQNQLRDRSQCSSAGVLSQTTTIWPQDCPPTVGGVKHCCDPSVRLSVCLSICSKPLARLLYILRLWLLWNTNRKPHARCRTGQRCRTVTRSGRNARKTSPAQLQKHS